MYKAITFGLLLVILSLAQQSFAAKFDGSAPLLCASMEAIECGVSGDCYGGSAESVNIPQFLKIDFAEKIVKTLEEGEKKVRSPIRTLEQTEWKET